ncbi:MAG: response regulator transcription factor [Syntrophorhabdaceae bacterium]|nr:response regulator transcription factor [Syntrophorhabdaceae bacterium]
MINVIIVDDHPVVIKGLKEIILENFSNLTIDDASSGHELLEKIQKVKYDLVILDISLPDINGLEVLKEVKKRQPRLSVLIISMYPENDYAIRAIKAGAKGYITKRSAPDELILAMRKILSGKRYVSPTFLEQMIFDFEEEPEKSPHQKLSDRELQVMCLLGKGKCIKEIAYHLHLSVNTVRTYRARVLEKIGLKGTNELIHYVIKHGLTD